MVSLREPCNRHFSVSVVCSINIFGVETVAESIRRGQECYGEARMKWDQHPVCDGCAGK